MTAVTPLTALTRERVNPVSGVNQPHAPLDALAAETQRLARLSTQKQAALAAWKKARWRESFRGRGEEGRHG